MSDDDLRFIDPRVRIPGLDEDCLLVTASFTTYSPSGEVGVRANICPTERKDLFRLAFDYARSNAQICVVVHLAETPHVSTALAAAEGFRMASMEMRSLVMVGALDDLPGSVALTRIIAHPLVTRNETGAAEERVVWEIRPPDARVIDRRSLIRRLRGIRR
jgi:hypothetical protein